MANRREDTREAFGDAVYSAWRRGLDSDRVEYDRVRDAIHDGCTRDEAVERELGRLSRERDRRTAAMSAAGLCRNASAFRFDLRMTMTPEQKAWIDNATFEQLLERNRFAPAGSPWFAGETGEYYLRVMAEKACRRSRRGRRGEQAHRMVAPTNAPHLEPCPWCPTERTFPPVLRDAGDDINIQVWCQRCGSSGPQQTHADDAIAAWNRVSQAARGTAEATR